MTEIDFDNLLYRLLLRQGMPEDVVRGYQKTTDRQGIVSFLVQEMWFHKTTEDSDTELLRKCTEHCKKTLSYIIDVT